jgi:hypothetical protein
MERRRASCACLSRVALRALVSRETCAAVRRHANRAPTLFRARRRAGTRPPVYTNVSLRGLFQRSDVLWFGSGRAGCQDGDRTPRSRGSPLLARAVDRRAGHVTMRRFAPGKDSRLRSRSKLSHLTIGSAVTTMVQTWVGWTAAHNCPVAVECAESGANELGAADGDGWRMEYIASA